MLVRNMEQVFNEARLVAKITTTKQARLIITNSKRMNCVDKVKSGIQRSVIYIYTAAFDQVKKTVYNITC